MEDYIDGKLHVFDKDWPELPFAHREHIGCTVDLSLIHICLCYFEFVFIA